MDRKQVLSRLQRDLQAESANRIGDRAVALGWITSEQLDEALRSQKEEEFSRPLGAILIARRFITTAQLKYLLDDQRTEAERELAEAALPAEVRDALSRPDALFGRYIVVAEIGRGGAGQVVKAWQRDLHRWVALKLLQVDNPAVLARFMREARSAGKLRHPNIVGVFDVGQIDRRPYIAMEWIDGASLEGARLSATEAARVIASVAEAIHYAHEHGVIHRDLKPANILLDRARAPYVADFGLARDTHSTAEAVTVTGAIVGTPAYMAPEQAAGRADEVDRRTDVYGLGATMYQLLTGAPPYSGATVLEIAQQILTTDPPRIRALAPRVPAELAAIAEKAMTHDRARRYPTSLDLAEDLRRFIAGEPVVARPSGFTYRVAKRVRRHPAIWGLSALLALAIVVGATVSIRELLIRLDAQHQLIEQLTRQALIERTQRRLGEIETELARYADDARLAELYAELDAMTTELRGAELWLLRGQANLMRHREADAIADFTRAMQTPEWRAQASLGRVEAQLLQLQDLMVAGVETDRARRRAAALELLEQLEATGTLVELWRAYAEERYDDVERAATEEIARGGRNEEFYFMRGLVRGGVEDYSASLDRHHGHARVWLHRANARLLAGDPDGAIADFTEAIRLKPDYAQAFVNRGAVHHTAGRFAEAVADYTQALRHDPDHADAYHNRGLARLELGDAQGALADCTEAIRLRPDFIHAYCNRAGALAQLGRVEEALADFASAERIDADFAPMHFDRGIVLAEAGRDEEAVASFTRVIDLRDDVMAYYNRGISYTALDRFEEAVADFSAMIEREPDNPDGWINRGLARHEMGDLDGAIDDYDEAIRRDPRSAQAYNNRGVAYKNLGDYARAIDDYTQAIELDDAYAGAYRNRGMALAALDRPEEGIPDLDRAIELEPDAASHGSRAVVREMLGDLRGAREDLRTAIAIAPTDWDQRDLAERMLEDLERRLGPEF